MVHLTFQALYMNYIMSSSSGCVRMMRNAACQLCTLNVCIVFKYIQNANAGKDGSDLGLRFYFLISAKTYILEIEVNMNDVILKLPVFCPHELVGLR